MDSGGGNGEIEEFDVFANAGGAGDQCVRGVIADRVGKIAFFVEVEFQGHQAGAAGDVVVPRQGRAQVIEAGAAEQIVDHSAGADDFFVVPPHRDSGGVDVEV